MKLAKTKNIVERKRSSKSNDLIKVNDEASIASSIEFIYLNKVNNFVKKLFMGTDI